MEGGISVLVLDEISNHWIYGMAIAVSDGFIIIQGGKNNPKNTMRGWELLTQMKEGFLKWLSMKDLK